MKVVHFIGSIDQNSGGTAVYMQLLATELKNFTDLVVVTSNCVNPVGFSGIKIRYLNLKLTRWFQMKEEFRNILKEENPDVVHVNGIWDPQNFLFQKEAKKLGLKVIISPHGMLEPYILNRNSPKKKLALFLYQNRAIKSADYLHVTANSELKNIRNLGYNLPATIIPNGLNVSEAKLDDKVYIDHFSRNILFLSRIHPKKGIELLIEAVSELRDQNIRVIIAGEGEKKYIDHLRKLAELKEVDRKILFLGGVYGEDKWDLFRQADLFVLPTYSENFGIVVIEALAAGIPVITTKGTPWEELETFKCGWWIDLNVSNLSEAILQAVKKSREELKIMGQRGRQLVEDKYDNKVLAKEMFKFYNLVLSRESAV